MTSRRYSTSTLDPYSVVARREGTMNSPTPGYTNQQGQIVITPKGTWICAWTRGSQEAALDHNVCVARSRDGGLSWDAPTEVESASSSGRVPSWIVPFCVPHTGRIYAFYWWVTEPNPLRDAGHIYFRYSDDEGITWSARHPLPMPFHAGIDEPDQAFHGWNFMQPKIMSNGEVVFTFAKIRPSTIRRWCDIAALDIVHHRGDQAENHASVWHTQAFLMVCENLLAEENPEKLKFSVRPEGDHGIHALYPGRNFPTGDELCVNELSTGEWLGTFRAPVGHMYSCLSGDEGRSWSAAAPLRFCPGGPVIPQPNAAEPVFKLPDGRFVLLFHNNDGSANFGSGPWDQLRNRTPMWISVGRELKKARTPDRIVWSKPRIVLDNHIVFDDADSPGKYDYRTDVNYPHFFTWNGRYFITYCDRKLDILINEIAPELLDHRLLPVG